MQKVNADFMFQTDMETLQSPSNGSKYSNPIKSQAKSIEIPSKPYEMRLNYSISDSQSWLRTPKIMHKGQFGKHLHCKIKNKPLEKTYHNPILDHKFSPKSLKLPHLPLSVERTKGSYLKYSRYPIAVQHKHKYITILDNFHLSN